MRPLVRLPIETELMVYVWGYEGKRAYSETEDNSKQIDQHPVIGQIIIVDGDGGDREADEVFYADVEVHLA